MKMIKLLMSVFCLYVGFECKVNTTVIKYDKRIRPYYGEQPVNVSTKIYVRNLKSIDENEFAYQLDYIIYHWYKDPRLAVNATSADFLNSLHYPDDIWFPNLGLLNCRDNSPVMDSSTIKLQPDGKVFAHKRMTAKCYCIMDMAGFPMDTQFCPLILESYYYSTKDMKLTWNNPAVQFEDGLEISGYDLQDPMHRIFTMDYGYGVWEYLEARFVVRRMYLHFVYRVYIPIILLMIFNMGSYWIPQNALPARVTLIMTTFLTITFILQSVSAQTAKASTSTSLQVFLVFSVLLVVVAMVEYLVILFLGREQTDKSKEEDKNEESETVANSHAGPEISLRKITKGGVTVISPIPPVDDSGPSVTIKKEKKSTPVLLDEIFRVLVPSIYLLFNIIYFSYYLSEDRIVPPF